MGDIKRIQMSEYFRKYIKKEHYPVQAYFVGVSVQDEYQVQNQFQEHDSRGHEETHLAGNRAVHLTPNQPQRTRVGDDVG
jgi:hypothetical protein